MKTLDIIVWVAFLLVPVICLIPFLVRGIKNNLVQSICHLVFFVIGVVVAFALTKFVFPKLAFREENFTNIDLVEFNALIVYLFGDGKVSVALNSLVLAIVAPLVFWALFIVIELFLWLVSGLIANLALKKIRFSSTGAKVVSRILSLVLNFAICFSACVVFYMPVTYYLNLANQFSTIDMGGVSFEEENGETQNEIIGTILGNPVQKLYSQLSAPVTAFLTKTEVFEQACQADEMLFTLVGNLNDTISVLQSGELDSKACADLAVVYREDPIVDEFVGCVLQDAVTSWNKGESFLDLIEPMQFYNEATTQAVYNAFLSNTLVSDDLDGISTILALAEAMGSEGGETAETPKDLYDVFDKLDDNSASFVEGFLTSDVLEGFGFEKEQAEILSTVATSAIDEVLKIKNDPTLTDEQKTQTLKEETEKLGSIMDMVSGDVSTDVLPSFIETVGSSLLLNSSSLSTISDAFLSEDKLLEMGMSKDDSKVLSTVCGSIVNGICDIKDDASMTKQEKDALIQKEAENIAYIIEFQNKEVEASDVTPIIQTVGHSKLISPEATEVIVDTYCTKEIFMEQGMTSAEATVISVSLDCVADGVNDIKTDPTLTEEQKSKKIDEEATYIGTVAEMVVDGVNSLAEAAVIIENISKSQILLSAAPELIAIVTNMALGK